MTTDHNIGKGDVTDTHVAESLDGTIKLCSDSSCHGAKPHGNEIDDHQDTFTCEACHIPSLPGGKALSLVDWSSGVVVKEKRMDEFTPTLAWYNGENAAEHPAPSASTSKDTTGAKVIIPI